MNGEVNRLWITSMLLVSIAGCGKTTTAPHPTARKASESQQATDPLKAPSESKSGFGTSNAERGRPPAQRREGAIGFATEEMTGKEDNPLPDLRARPLPQVGEVAVETILLPKIDPPPFRLLLPTEAGPLLVDLEILLDDVPLTVAFEQRIKRVMSDADVDKDQSTTWKEFLDHIAADAQQFGRNVAGNNGGRRNLIQLQDRNRNGNADFDEVVNVLFRNAGFDAPFRLRGTDYYRGRKGESKLFDAVDVDDDNVLSAEEIADATVSLFRLDRNTDQRIDLAEVTAPPATDNNDPAWNQRRSNRHGSVATDLFGYVDWSMMSYSLDDQRKRRPFGLLQNPVDRLDDDGNGSIDRQEVKALLQCDPDLIVTAMLSAKPGGQGTMAIRWSRPELQSLVQIVRQRNQVALADESLGLCISLQDRRTGQNQIPPEAFAMLDANNDGELDEAEIPDQFEELYSLEDFDADENGKLTLEEINQGMLGKSPIWSVQMRGRAAEFPDVLFAYLDADNDQSLSTREIASAPDRMSNLAKETDELTADEIPSMFLVQIVRGDPALRDRLFDIQSPENLTGLDTLTELPRWASRMDSNSDGEISRWEFLGSTEQFDKLDTTEDGFIDITEVQSLENSK